MRTYTDLATMEGANEAARRAVNGILDATRSNARSAARSGRCASRRRFKPARTLDKPALAPAPPAPSPLRVSTAGEVEPMGVIGRALSLLRR